MTSKEHAVEFSYRIVGPGWSEARFSLGEQWVGLTASYLTDALGDLLAAVYGLVQGSTGTRVSWALEPGEYRWLFAREGGSVKVRVLSFEEDFDDPADENGRVELDGKVPLDPLVQAVAAGAREVLDEYGEAEYRKRWIEHPFPTAILSLLEASIESSGSGGLRQTAAPIDDRHSATRVPPSPGPR